MPETLRELIDHARASGDWNAVADWCESYDWSQADEVPVEEYLLDRVVRTRVRSEDEVAEAVAAAVAGGATWDRIGHILGVAAPEAQQRFATTADRADTISR